MCNLSGYVEEKGIEKGIKKGIKIGELGVLSLYQWLKGSDRNDEAEEILKPENNELRQRLYEEMKKEQS